MNKERGLEGASSIKVIPWSDLHKRRRISRGGQAYVYEADLKTEARIVAVKEVFPDSDEEDDETFCGEARLMARLCHPNIISFHGVAVDTDIDIDDSVYIRDIVLDYMPNGNLHDALKEDKDFGLLPWRSRVLIAHQIAAAMEYVHSTGIIHFDLKAANVLLDLSDPTRPSCKICDFGCAREKQDDMTFMHSIGTCGHMAPEVAFKGKKITEKADIYGFGVIMFELLTGNMWFKPNLRRTKHVAKCYLQDAGHHKSVPDWCYHQWRGLMRDCLAIKWSRRPAFREVVAKLRDMLAALPES